LPVEDRRGDQCCGSESELFFAESEIFVPDSDSVLDSDSDPVPDPII
jgi:hypothetical protein